MPNHSKFTTTTLGLPVTSCPKCGESYQPAIETHTCPAPQSPASEEMPDEFFCNKCGYFGGHGPWHLRGGSPEAETCEYMAGETTTSKLRRENARLTRERDRAIEDGAVLQARNTARVHEWQSALDALAVAWKNLDPCHGGNKDPFTVLSGGRYRALESAISSLLSTRPASVPPEGDATETRHG